MYESQLQQKTFYQILVVMSCFIGLGPAEEHKKIVNEDGQHQAGLPQYHKHFKISHLAIVGGDGPMSSERPS